MEPINLEKMKRFAGFPAVIFIQDSEGGDQAPAVKKKVKKVQECPEGTHIRFYFDDFYFLAVPIKSEIRQTETEFSAFDTESGLHYTVKKVQDF